jgi:calcineurin-like phosphoesterase
MATDTAIRRALTQMPLKMEVNNQNAEINGVLLEIDARSGNAITIERVREVASV